MMSNRINNEGIELYSVLSADAIEQLKEELLVESGFVGDVLAIEEKKHLLLIEYLRDLNATGVQVIPGVFDPNLSYHYCGTDQSLVSEEEIQQDYRDVAQKVRLRRRNAYFAKKNLGRKAQIASNGKRARWMDDHENHVGHLLIKGTEIIKVGEKGSKTERMWRLNKAAKKVGMVDDATA